jgi:acetyl-CoA carboxylase carboxyl transferase subunit beta
MAFSKTIQENANVCPECGHHMKLEAQRRVEMLLDAGSFQPIGEDVAPVDVLRFSDGSEPYDKKLQRTRAKGGSTEACLAGRGTMGGRPVVLAVLDFGFLGGSMGHAVGEKIALAVDVARETRVPCVVFSASGGARMHEGALSLMQMAKVAAALARLDRARLPYVSVLTDPTTGGVTASYAMLGDLNIAEPKALIGFAGPRVIEQTIRQKLPEGFQRSEFLLERGMLDLVVDRRELKATLARALRFMA